MGIFGIAVSDGQPVQAHELDAMCLGVGSRPGGGDSCVRPHVGLSATPLTSEAWFSSDLMVVCDADLYGCAASTNGSVAKSIGALYRGDGLSFLEKLRGAFALAIWDQTARLLLLAADRFGIKRLCYAPIGSGIIFASRPSDILSTRRISKKVNLSGITDYFVYNTVPAPKTSFEGITRMAPGEYLQWTEKGPHTKCYWQMQYSENARESPRTLARELLSRMSDSVASASADLDLSKTGCYLSGGTDSSSIVGLLTEARKAPVNAVSIGFSEPRFNELEYARLAAQHFHARHIVGFLRVEDAQSVIDKLVASYDEPFANASAIPSYWCAKLAREHGIEVLLAGDGGDELFGGNERYRTEEIYGIYQKVPRLARQWLIEPALFTAPINIGFLAKMRSYIQASNMANPDRYCRWRLLQKFPPEVVLGSEMPFRNGHSDLLAVMRGHYSAAPAHSELNRLLYVDVKMTLGDDDLPKVTRTAELAGVKVRFPYLDHELAEFSGCLPAKFKVHNLEKRYLFKLATQQLLPAKILRKKKHGFGLPIGIWLKSDPTLHSWAKEVLFDPKTYQRGYFRRDFVEQLFKDLQRDDTPYFGDLLWVFLVLELWHRRHVEGSSC